MYLRVRVKGRVWMVHKADADPFPPHPDAHDYDTGHVADLGTGRLYDPRRKNYRKSPIGRLARVELERLRTDVSKKWPDTQLAPISM
jgi:hypothetical protein